MKALDSIWEISDIIPAARKVDQPRTTTGGTCQMMHRVGLMQVGFWLALMASAFVLLEGGPTKVSAQSTEGTEFDFTFENDDESWITGFADLPADFDPETFELDSGFRQLPEGLEGNGVFLQGHNRSDDLFMFLKKQVAGLRPGTTYTVTSSLDLATNVPAGAFGIGGSPGESVYVKSGASPVEPTVAEDSNGWLRMSIDKGNQAREGTEMINVGNVAHPEVEGEEYKIKTLDSQDRPFEVITDSQGQVWLIVGTDSGFEGLSAFYYARVNYILNAVEQPVELPIAGDLALSNWSIAGMAVLGATFAGLGTVIMARTKRRIRRQ